MSALSAVPFRDGTTGLRDGCSTSSSPDLLCDCHPVNVPAEIFRTYDIRGIVGRTLTPAIVRAVGRALGTLARERGAPTFAVGRDGRLSGPELSDAVMDAMLAWGASAVDIGMAPTPVTYFAAHHLGCGSCVSVTGSHNPPDYNGLKVVIGGDTLYGDDIQLIRKIIDQATFEEGKGKRNAANVLDAFVERAVSPPKLPPPMRISLARG